MRETRHRRRGFIERGRSSSCAEGASAIVACPACAGKAAGCAHGQRCAEHADCRLTPLPPLRGPQPVTRSNAAERGWRSQERAVGTIARWNAIASCGYGVEAFARARSRSGGGQQRVDDAFGGVAVAVGVGRFAPWRRALADRPSGATPRPRSARCRCPPAAPCPPRAPPGARSPRAGTSTGVPSAGASSCTPPESDSTR